MGLPWLGTGQSLAFSSLPAGHSGCCWLRPPGPLPACRPAGQASSAGGRGGGHGREAAKRGMPGQKSCRCPSSYAWPCCWSTRARLHGGCLQACRTGRVAVRHGPGPCRRCCGRPCQGMLRCACCARSAEPARPWSLPWLGIVLAYLSQCMEAPSLPLASVAGWLGHALPHSPCRQAGGDARAAAGSGAATRHPARPRRRIPSRPLCKPRGSRHCRRQQQQRHS